MAKTKAPAVPDFETALCELEQLVQRMEEGSLPLDVALQTFERGVHLTRICQDALQGAEQRVQVLQLDGSTSVLPAMPGNDSL